MNSFYTLVLSVALICLILILSYFGIMMSYEKQSVLAYPPVSNTCPDYWAFNNTSGCVLPGTGESNWVAISMVDKLTGYTADSSNSYIDFRHKNWTNPCDKKKWANQNGISWDGISNYNMCD